MAQIISTRALPIGNGEWEKEARKIRWASDLYAIVNLSQPRNRPETSQSHRQGSELRDLLHFEVFLQPVLADCRGRF